MRNLLADILESQYTVNASTFRELWDDTVVDMCGTWVSIFLYAFYLNLFFVAIYTLARRNTAGKKVLLGFTWATVVLATTQMALRLSTSVTNVRTLLQFIEQKPIERSIGASETLRLAQGALYCIGALLLATTTQLGIVYAVLEATAMYLVNIVPILIIVRVCLGHHTRDATEIAASLAANATHQSIILSARPSDEKLRDQLPEEM
ncbi:hypothetical protein B0H19DRAFT_1247622 [Mycena capillaripes]|nr:hypothetical protein B0H19DRAFT_1247622 [Mycena capillaripes]